MATNYIKLKRLLEKKYRRDYLKIEEVMAETNLGRGQVRMYLHSFKVTINSFRLDGVA